MITKVSNPDGLLDNELDRKVERVKVLLINDKNELLLCHTDDGYSFIGGHIEEGESPKRCLKRELLEEAGISIFVPQADLFFERKSYESNYFGSGKNCLSIIYYFVLKTNKPVNASRMKLDEKEKKKNFELKFVPLADVERVLAGDEMAFEKFGLYVEMLEVLNAYHNSQAENIKKAE